MRTPIPTFVAVFSAIVCGHATAFLPVDLAQINLNPPTQLPLVPMATRHSGDHMQVYLFDIQGAIDDAQPGDRIEISPGRWDGDLVISHKSDIELFAPAGPAETVIDGGHASRGLLIDESSNITIRGLGFEHCIHDAEHHFQRGGAVMCESSDHITFAECWFRNNHSLATGGGLDTRRCDWLTLRHCFFAHNLADGDGNANGSGGGASINYSDNAFIDQCVFYDNWARWGGALEITGRLGGEVTISETYFLQNVGDGGAAIWTDNPPNADSSVIMSQCVLANNESYGHLLCGAVWVGDGITLQSLATMYWKNRGRNAASIGVANEGDLQMFGSTHAGNRAANGEDVMILWDNANAMVQNCRIDCGQSFAAEILGNYSTLGHNEAIDHCVYTADLNFDATVDMVDLLTLLDKWGQLAPDFTDIDRGDMHQPPAIDAHDLILLLETWGQSAENPLL